MNKQLLILGCSQTKRKCDGLLPAIDRYDGPPFRVIRKFLQEHQWPSNVSIAVLSAKYGLFGSLKGIEYYDMRMNASIYKEKAREYSNILKKWTRDHHTVHLSVGKDYLNALQPALDSSDISQEVFQGGIGKKMSNIKSFLESTSSERRERTMVEGGTGKRSYFLPDWDDLLDPNFDFEQDAFSEKTREKRGDKHCCVLMQPEQMCDGVLLSLAQNGTSKGPLRRLKGTELGALSPLPLRSQFGLSPHQHLFGDCGAFSYVNEERPIISVEQAVSLYELYDFDFGASVDHIPVKKIIKNGKKILLSDDERQERVDLTRENAKAFIEATNNRKALFNPVGIIQALSPDQYAQSVWDYYDFGYRHIALGGLVPLGDSEIKDIVRAVVAAADDLKERPWIHLFGIFRPKLQGLFQELKIDSFDSATYFRKAWLRSGQNYFGKNGKWYAALRVPMTSDGRTRRRLIEANADIAELEQEERKVLDLLCRYDKDQATVDEVLEALLSYDQHLARSSETQSMREQYRRTLEDRPWRMCECPFCKEIGIHTLIFRGANRNKRRGAHNTLMLYGDIQKGNHVQSI
jgi:hypothetical protein